MAQNVLSPLFQQIPTVVIFRAGQGDLTFTAESELLCFSL